MPATLTLSRFDLNYSAKRRTYNPITYLSKVGWDDKAYVIIKSSVVCFVMGIAPVQRPVRHKDLPRIEIIRRKETPAEERLRRSVKWLDESSYLRILGGPDGRMDTVRIALNQEAEVSLN